MEEDGHVYELSCLASNIKKEVVQVLDSFLFLLKKNEERKAYNMFSLILDPRFKTLCLVFSFIGCEQGKVIVEEYDNFFKFPMLLKCYHHLHPLAEFARGVGDQRVEKHMSLDTSKPITKLVNRELLIFSVINWMLKDIKCPL
jgi:hypothetical protein